ncbi:MAG TPA: hypothetical protein VFB20_16825 [Burkholderiales bacterium]|nr:hypothetical protein [Burkholderiales bacterium]
MAGAECLRAADPARRAARYAAALLAGTAIWLAAAQDGGAENLLVLRAGIDEVVMIDRDSISREGSHAQAWLVRRLEPSGSAGQITEIRERYVFDCRAGLLGLAERRPAAGKPDTAAPAPLRAPESGLERTVIALACMR